MVFVRWDGTRLAAPFNQDELVVTGPPIPLLSGVQTTPGPDVAISASGRLTYATTRSSGWLADIVWIDRPGNTTTVERGLPVNPNIGGGHALSPDGTRFAVAVLETGFDIWSGLVGEGPLTRLTFDGNATRPVWSPDGLSVVYRAGISEDLLTKRADGTRPAEMLVDHDVGEVATGFWSNDGEWLITTSDDGDIYALRPQVDTVPEPLLAEEYNESAPALSPDGLWLAYVSDESGRPEIYIRPFPNVAVAKHQVSIAGGVEPRWAHSGRELFYKTPSREFVVATVTADQQFSVNHRNVLFTLDPSLPNYAPVARYDVSPNDQRFLTLRLVESAQDAGAAIVVENFLVELQSTLGR